MTPLRILFVAAALAMTATSFAAEAVPPSPPFLLNVVEYNMDAGVASEHSTPLTCKPLSSKDAQDCRYINALKITLSFGVEDWRRLGEAGRKRRAELAAQNVYSSAAVASAVAKDQYGQFWVLDLYTGSSDGERHPVLSSNGEIDDTNFRSVSPYFIGYELHPTGVDTYEILRVFPTWDAWNAEVEKETGIRPRYNGDMPKAESRMRRLYESVVGEAGKGKE